MEYLIVGLGNPGTKYALTRHNMGFMVVQSFAEKQGWTFKSDRQLLGACAHGKMGENTIHLLMPATYMNLSGQAVRKSFDYYKIALPNLLIVVDDVYIKFGAMRLRPQGSPGGHNGLKSVEEHMNSTLYSRLRVGVGGSDLPERSLEEYVLAPFGSQHQAELPQVIEKGVSVLECWIKQGTEPAMQLAGDLSKS